MNGFSGQPTAGNKALEARYLSGKQRFRSAQPEKTYTPWFQEVVAEGLGHYGKQVGDLLPFSHAQLAAFTR